MPNSTIPSATVTSRAFDWALALETSKSALASCAFAPRVRQRCPRCDLKSLPERPQLLLMSGVGLLDLLLIPSHTDGLFTEGHGP